MLHKEPLLSVRDISVAYGPMVALHPLSFDVLSGQVITFIGANGAGKSTLLNAIIGLVKPFQGRVVYRGDDITAHTVPQRVRAGIVMSPEGRGIFARSSVLDNLLLGAFVKKDRHWIQERQDHLYTRWPLLYQKRHLPAGVLSGGERQILALSRAMMSDPVLLCLDEPTLGLAPVFIDLVFDWLAELKKEGLSILLVEQNADRALSLAHYAYALELGHIKTSGDAEELARSPDVLSAYFG